MPHRPIASQMYVAVCGLLIALTVLTVGVSFVELKSAWHLTAGLVLGGVKAALVGLVFMHLVRSGKITWAVVAVTLLWVVILFGLTLTDYLTRERVPFMPGH
jgi:cytochrome c oxidase subunit 4